MTRRSFSDFIRNAPPEERRQVFQKCLKEASRKQNEQIKRAIGTNRKK